MSRAKKPRKPPAGVRGIAKLLGISIGTVDRALHDRPDISPKTQKRILEMARKVGYRPNLAARFLSSRRYVRIGIILPREIAPFWDLIREGIADTARSVENNGVQIVHHSYPRLGEGEIEALDKALEDDVQGLLIAP